MIEGKNMDNTNARFKKYIVGRCIGVTICILLVSTSLTTALDATSRLNSKDNCLSYSFMFIKPELQTTYADISQYTTLQMSGCMAIGKQAGDPMLPVKSVKLLLPAMTTVTSVTVTGISIELISIKTPIYPYQNPVPIGFEPEEFQFNTALYDSDLLYPSALDDGYHIGYSHGYAILDITFNPVQYIPGEGRIFYYPELTVTIDLEDTGELNQFFRDSPEDKSWVEKLVYNPEVTDTYTTNLLNFEYPGGLCDPSDNYDYVIITTTHNGLDYWETNGSTPYNWESLMNKHEQDNGLTCTLVTIQDINVCLDYYNPDSLFNDTEAHIREFCKDAYGDWGTSYIFIGGDDEWIPARHMKYAYEGNVDSDIYWSNLDKTFNDDHDSEWGEEEDLGFDLYSELFIGRITCDIPQDVSNWMTKSFYYADSSNIDYLENAAFYGGSTGWPCQGDDFIDYSAIKGMDYWLGPNPPSYPPWLGFNYGFETWNAVNPDNKYNLSIKWTAESPNPGWIGGNKTVAINGLKTAINNDHVTLISGIAHADATMSLEVSRNSWEANYHNTKPFFIHDYGCHCGDMDDPQHPNDDDGVLHSMLFHSDTELAFACVYNTGYGWGNLYSTESSSALQQKLFWDYLFDVVNNSGSQINWQLGKAMVYSKDMMAPTINWTYPSPGCWRAIIQGCLLFGDPAQRIKAIAKPPKTPERPNGPTEGVVGMEYTFLTSTTDPDGDQVSYLWDWGDETPTEWTDFNDSGVTVYARHTWDDAKTYEIKVKARNTHNIESDWSPPLMICIADIPVLEIGNITGKLFKVSTVIRNIGGVDATMVDWSIVLDGGLIILGEETNGNILCISAGDEVKISSDLIFGFGNTVVTVTSEELGVSLDTKEQDAFMFLFFIKILDE